MKKAWETHLNERELKEVNFCREYAKNFAHGTDGHSRLMLIAKMAELLDKGVVPYIAPKIDSTQPAQAKPTTMA
jgi:hypothetical protein